MLTSTILSLMAMEVPNTEMKATESTSSASMQLQQCLLCASKRQCVHLSMNGYMGHLSISLFSSKNKI